jgi:hypothetical protein
MSQLSPLYCRSTECRSAECRGANHNLLGIRKTTQELLAIIPEAVFLVMCDPPMNEL